MDTKERRRRREREERSNEGRKRIRKIVVERRVCRVCRIKLKVSVCGLPLTFEVKENYSNLIERKTLNTAIRIWLIKNA